MMAGREYTSKMDLNGYVAVYIPTKDIEGNLLREMEYNIALKEVEVGFSQAFGSFTVYEVKGGWEGVNGLVIEDITVVKAFYKAKDEVALAEATRLAKIVKQRLRQEAVTIEMNGGISFT